MRRVLAALLVATALTGCGTPPPGEAKIDVDTPQLREIKRAADITGCRPGAADAVDDGLPEVTLPCLGGGEDVDVSSLEGPMVVNLWASWCGPCRKELPVLQQFHELYADLVPIVGIDYQDNQPQAALELARDSGVTYPLLADPQSDLDGVAPFRDIRLPMFAFIDESGTVVVEAAGIDEVDDLTALVEKNLGISL